MKKVLVTGATGFIGTHLVSRLLEEKYNVSVFVRNRKKLDKNILKTIQIFEGDISDKNAVKLIDPDIDVAFHLAAQFPQRGPGDEKEAKSLYNVNLEGTRNILEVLSCGSLRQFIYISSVSVYDGLIAEERIDECTEVSPDNYYGLSKLAAEGLVRDFGEKASFMTTVLRVPFVYGPGNKRNIFKMIEAVDHGRFFIVGNGDNPRSAIYVDNLVEAAILATSEQKTPDETFIVTDERDYTLKELYALLSEALGKNPSRVIIPINLGKFLAWTGDLIEKATGKQMIFNSDVLRRLTRSFYFSSEKIHKELGYEAKYDFCDTIRRTVEWYRNNAKGKT